MLKNFSVKNISGKKCGPIPFRPLHVDFEFLPAGRETPCRCLTPQVEEWYKSGTKLTPFHPHVRSKCKLVLDVEYNSNTQILV
mgnify:CR=1 FL=1